MKKLKNVEVKTYPGQEDDFGYHAKKEAEVILSFDDNSKISSGRYGVGPAADPGKPKFRIDAHIFHHGSTTSGEQRLLVFAELPDGAHVELGQRRSRDGQWVEKYDVDISLLS